jgi:V8-like Glu-specific endopeptidase
VSLRTRRRGTPGVRFIVVLTAGALAVGGTMVAARAAGAAGAAGASGAASQPGAAYQVSAAAQRAALAFWTPARMTAAQSQALRQGARNAASTAVKPPKGIPSAVHYAGVPTIGALFYTTGSGKDLQSHFCTASVVDSTAGDLILTAAHCVYSTKPASNIEYVPEYNNGHTPYGAWAVAWIRVAAGWISSHNPNLDFAFLTLSPLKGRKIQSVTGGLAIAFTRWYRETIEVVGYNDTDSEPIRCLTKSFPFRVGQMEFPEFYCHGFWTGTSGGPWITGYNAKNGTGTLFGVIGGYEEGGQYEWASYTSYFGPQARILFGQAETTPVPTPSPTPTPTHTATSAPTPSPTAT